MKTPLTLLFAIGLASCAAPKAVIVQEVPAKPTEKKEAAAPAPEPRVPALANDGLRLPDMLAMPDEDQLRSSPGATNGGNATVITRPPKE